MSSLGSTKTLTPFLRSSRASAFAFRVETRALFSGQAAGRLVSPTLEETFQQTAEPEGWVAELEQRLQDEQSQCGRV